MIPQASPDASPGDAEALRLRLRETGRDATWDQDLESLLEAAFVADDMRALSEGVHLMITSLDAEARFDDALVLGEHSAEWAAKHPGARALLQTMTAGVLLAKGKVEAARNAIATAARDEPLLDTSLGRSTFASTVAVVDLVSFSTGAARRSEVLLADPVVADDARARLFVLSWLAPHLVAVGQRRRAEPWLRILRMLARQEVHQWRIEDALSLDYALRVGVRCLESDAGVQAPAETENNTADMRRVLARLRAAVVRRDWKGVIEPLDRVGEIGRTLDGATFGSPANFRAVVEAHRDGEISTEIVFPTEAHLGNLPTTLAGAEAIAYAGTQAQAIAAVRALAAIPRTVQTSLEWPVARARVDGLLALRVGREKEARRRIEHARDWATEAGYELERNLAAFQLGELFASGTLMVSSRQGRDKRRDAAAALLASGIDAAPHAYPVARAFTVVAEGAHVARLAPREVEVLRQLATGATYKQAALALGVAHSTVQTLAHRSYDKLGVEGRVAALNLARELGIL